MISAWRLLTVYVMILTILPQNTVQKMKSNLYYPPFLTDRRLQEIFPYVTDDEFLRQIHSIVNSYGNREDLKRRLVIETNALIDTKYRKWKRNADLINSLLALPRGMSEAGR